MTVNELITSIFQVCIIPLFGVLTTFIVKWINAKRSEIQGTLDDAVLNKYLNLLSETITSCVIATNQTYVDSLKAQGKFDTEAQKEAFRRTAESIMNILTDDAKTYLEQAFGDLEAYIKQRIEAEVNLNKSK